MPEMYSVRRVGDACWEVLAPDTDPFGPPVRAVAVLAEPCAAGPDVQAGTDLEI
jgi:hypothetical protein